MSVLTSQLGFSHRRSKKEFVLGLIDVLKAFQASSTHFFFPESSWHLKGTFIHLQPMRRVYWIHKWNLNKDGKEIQSLRGRTQWGGGARALSQCKNVPVRADVTFQRVSTEIFSRSLILFSITFYSPIAVLWFGGFLWCIQAVRQVSNKPFCFSKTHNWKWNKDVNAPIQLNVHCIGMHARQQWVRQVKREPGLTDVTLQSWSQRWNQWVKCYHNWNGNFDRKRTSEIKIQIIFFFYMGCWCLQ